MNPQLDTFLAQAQSVMVGELNSGASPPETKASFGLQTEELDPWDKPQRRVHVGVDLGTAYTVLAVLDEQKQPLAGEYRFAQIVRDGLVVDFHGAISLLRELKQNVEARLGFELTTAATTYPPGVPGTEVRATRHVVEAAGFECQNVVDEPTAANAVLQIENGAVVDVGGGTTGIAIFRQGEVIYTADEATGGTHFSLVIAGALNIMVVYDAYAGPVRSGGTCSGRRPTSTLVSSPGPAATRPRPGAISPPAGGFSTKRR